MLKECLVLVDRENKRFIVKANPSADADGSYIIDFDVMSTPELLLGWIRWLCALPHVSFALISDLIVAYSGVFSDMTRAHTPLTDEIGYLFCCGEPMTTEQFKNRIAADCRKFNVPEINKNSTQLTK